MLPLPRSLEAEAGAAATLVNDGHRLERVVDAVATVGEGVLDGQHEARGELAKGAAGVHEGRRIGLEPALRHERVEIRGDGCDLVLGGSIACIGFSDHGRDAPEEVFRTFGRLSGLVLDEVALLEDGARVGRQRDGTGGWLNGQGHGATSPGIVWLLCGTRFARRRRGAGGAC